jgi:hypothetical protein
MPRSRPEHDWRDLHRPNDDDFADLCRNHGISDQAAFRDFLDELVVHGQRWLGEVRDRGRLPDARRICEKEAKRLERIARAIRALQTWRRGKKSRLLAPAGLEFLTRVLADHLSGVLSTDFLSRIIDEGPPPEIDAGPGRAIRSGSMHEVIDNLRRVERDWVDSVLDAHSLDVLGAVLDTIQSMLSNAAVKMTERSRKGGPNPYVVAPWVLLNLAEAFHRFGGTGRPAKNIDGPFGCFVLDVVEAIGLETVWVESQIGPAVSEWRRRSRYNHP